MTCKTMKQNENDQNHKKESTPVVDDKPNGKSQSTSKRNQQLDGDLKIQFPLLGR